MFQWILPVLTLSSLALGRPAAANDGLPSVQVAEDVELGRYVGLWYELARTPNIFQLGCTCTTAYYTPRSESSIGIQNACNNFFPRASVRVAEGLGVVGDPNRDFLFILSRTPRPRGVADNAALEGIFERLREQQYPTAGLRRTRQPRRCTYEESVPEE